MPGRWRKAYERRLTFHAAQDALVAIEAASLVWASEEYRKERLDYWFALRNGVPPAEERPANVVPFGTITARSFDDLAGWLGKANRDMAGTS